MQFLSSVLHAHQPAAQPLISSATSLQIRNSASIHSVAMRAQSSFSTPQGDNKLFKIVSKEEWERSQDAGEVVPGSLDIDTGFIHLATSEQVQKVADKFWKGREYIIVPLDPTKFTGRLVLERNNPGGQEFYHLYEGRIPLAAVVDIEQ